MAEKLELDDGIYSLNVKDCFITVKDHKENFENNTTCRLLNPRARVNLVKSANRYYQIL